MGRIGTRDKDVNVHKMFLRMLFLAVGLQSVFATRTLIRLRVGRCLAGDQDAVQKIGTTVANGTAQAYKTVKNGTQNLANEIDERAKKGYLFEIFGIKVTTGWAFVIILGAVAGIALVSMCCCCMGVLTKVLCCCCC